MSTTANPPVLTTPIKGYFNPNSYRVNVAISELNIAVQLGPMEFILDRLGRKVNDPLLDSFVGRKMLSPELSRTPVPLILIPRAAAAVAPDSRHVVTAGVKSKAGKWGPAPASAVPPAVAAPSAMKSSTVGMPIEEARRRGFVGKPRLVPDDYGSDESGNTPREGSRIPPMRYATESVAPKAAPGPLPPEFLQEVTAAAAPMLQVLKQAAAASDPEKVDLDRKAAEQAVQHQQGKAGVQAFRKEIKQVQPAKVAPPRKLVGKVVQAKVVPVAVAPESPLVGGGRATLPEPEVPEAGQPEDTGHGPAVPDTANRHQCGACASSYKVRSQLVRHVQKMHTDQAEALLA